MTKRDERLVRLSTYEPAMIERLLLLCEPRPTGMVIDTPEKAADVLIPLLVGFENERLVIAGLDAKNRLIETTTLTIGSSGFTVVCPKQILRWVFSRKKAVHGILLGHNHPSGDCTPSSQDRDVTRRIKQACGVVGINFIDHLVVTNDSWSRVEV